jgi:hypothetical protein
VIAKRDKRKEIRSPQVRMEDLTHCALGGMKCEGICAKSHRTWEDGDQTKPCIALMTARDAQTRRKKKKRKKSFRRRPKDDEDQGRSRRNQR